VPRVKDQAICVRLLDWSQSSQIVTLLTQHHGKFTGVAKGSKRNSPSSMARFSGGFELLTRGQVLAAVKDTGELAALTEWDLQETFPHLRRSLQAHQFALYAADLTHALLADLDAHPQMFAALDEFLASLGNPDPPTLAIALLRFQWRTLADAGYQPQLDRDMVSGSPLPPARTYVFDPVAGGFTLPALALENRPGRWAARPKTLAALRDAAAGLFDSLDPLDVQRANRLLASYATVLLDRELPTVPFLLASLR
jgi:DNA repair protein RecO (recombination protein O)